MTGGRLSGAARRMRTPQRGLAEAADRRLPGRASGAGPILVDTGLHASVAVDPKQNLGPLLRPRSTVRDEARAGDPGAAARARASTPARSPLVVMTHLHMDHASAISDFTEATYVLGEGEWAAFHAPAADLQRLRPQAGRRTRSTTARSSTTPPRRLLLDLRRARSTCSATARCAWSTRPGHSLGHQSLILRLKDREALIAGDAIYFLDDARARAARLRMADEHNWRRSLREIQLYRRENPDALIIPSHDQELWDGLAEKYE